MNTVYIVIQNGVYRHKVGGAYTNVEDAEDRAKELASISDGYHFYSVEELQLDVSCDDCEEVCTYKAIEKRYASEPLPPTKVQRKQ